MRTMFPLIDRRILLSGGIGGKAGPYHAPLYGAQMLRFRRSWHVVDQCPTLTADVLFGQTCPAISDRLVPRSGASPCAACDWPNAAAHHVSACSSC
ncbi:hypothetical protein XavaCFBP5823_15950 [Xanthomonas axonopodis pv. vasculorum]|nr:hypothetical protein XavaCFBP5823_15950 [Xanthomonas axonopodis pv. vasculorum]